MQSDRLHRLWCLRLASFSLCSHPTKGNSCSRALILSRAQSVSSFRSRISISGLAEHSQQVSAAPDRPDQRWHLGLGESPCFNVTSRTRAVPSNSGGVLEQPSLLLAPYSRRDTARPFSTTCPLTASCHRQSGRACRHRAVSLPDESAMGSQSVPKCHTHDKNHAWLDATTRVPH